MNRVILKFIFVLFVFVSKKTDAQIPYFSSTAGSGNLYGYTSLKFRPGHNAQETYTCFQYGLGNQTAVGIDVYTGIECAYWGTLLRWGKQFSPYLGVGAQFTPSFDLNDNFKYSYSTAALYLNGDITSDGRLFWCSNTWFGINRGDDNTFSNWEFLGYTFKMKSVSLTPMMGLEHDWEFKENPDMLAGFYYSVRKWNFYLWGSDFFKSKNDPRIVFGADFKLSTKK